MARDPMYSDYLQFNPTFRWGGRSWGVNDKAAFERYLRKRGVKPSKWYQRHRTAAKSFDPVEQQIYGMFQPQLTAIDAERKRAADLWGRRMQNLTGFSTALMPYLQQVPGAIMTPYREGAAGVESAAQGYGGTLNADTGAEAEGINQVLSSIGAPEGQMAEQGDPGGVLAGLGGLEAQLMRATGGAYGAAASQLPKTASLEAQLMMKDLLSGAAETDSGFSNSVLQLLQGMPGARADIQDRVASQRLSQQKQILAEIKFQADQHYKNAMLALYNGDRKRYAAELKLAQQKEARYAAAQQGLSPTGDPLPGYHQDPSGEVVKDGWHVNPKTGIPVKDATSGSKGGANAGAKDIKTVAQYQDDIDRYIKGMGHEANPAEAAKLGVDPFTVVYPDFKAAYNRLWQRFKNTVSTPKGRKALDAAIRAALGAAGIKPAAAPTGGGQ